MEKKDYSNELDQKGLPVFIEFGVYSDEGGALELRFDHDFEFISLNGKADSEYYESIVKNQDILINCKNLIQNLDNYLLENGSYYNLRILKINDFDLSCIWDIRGGDYDAEALPIDDLKHFFKIETKEELIDDLEDIISDFDSNTMTSLEYLTGLSLIIIQLKVANHATKIVKVVSENPKGDYSSKKNG